jgi:ubiquinone/menaquinone biosynthesis C-methylase UbiE
VGDYGNAHLYLGDGMTLNCLGDRQFDFAYSCSVFHHIASCEVISSYLREVGRLLVPGGLFKFEAQGWTALRSTEGDTWLGVPLSLEKAFQMAEKCGFELRYYTGAGEERFWLWMFRNALTRRAGTR